MSNFSKGLFWIWIGLILVLTLASAQQQDSTKPPKKIPIEVRDSESNSLLSSATIKIKSKEEDEEVEEYSKKVNWVSPSYLWKHDGFKTYTFKISSDGYNDDKIKIKLKESTSLITLLMTKNSTTIPEDPPFCGDGVCSGNETALPTSSTRCFDCGRIRGVVSLAVGQKEQLSNIQVSVWADPVNPALFLRNGSSVPAPQYTTTTDSKGFFYINNLSFDSPANNRSSGQTKRRFYFSLTGTTIQRTGGVEQTITLLPLWWNFELTNTQWSGTGRLTNTNNSPSLYFYMTPPFSTSEALIRVILSWGTLISNPSRSLPDVDLVVAGPVEPESLELYGTGIVNFQTKSLHNSNNVIPFVRLTSDSAQGFGPEVMDFYGSSSSPPTLGFSSTYANGAVANAYEIWVDRPNSVHNQDSAFTFLFDTNSLIVVYQNDGTPNGNKQILLDQITNVPFAYGFYNGDQWNKITEMASLWHVFDLSQVAQGIVFNGFPGENSTSMLTPEPPGAKYGYSAVFFEPTKTIPCGHVIERGANPQYCPATLSYPQ